MNTNEQIAQNIHRIKVTILASIEADGPATRYTILHAVADRIDIDRFSDGDQVFAGNFDQAWLELVHAEEIEERKLWAGEGGNCFVLRQDENDDDMSFPEPGSWTDRS